MTIEISDFTIVPTEVSIKTDNMDWLNVASILGVGTSHNLWCDNDGDYFYLVSPEGSGTRSGMQAWSRTPQNGKMIRWATDKVATPQDRVQVMTLAYQYCVDQAIAEVAAEYTA